MDKLLITIVFALISGCAFAEKYETLTINNQNITLNISKCYVRSGGQELSAEIDGNCFFIKESGSNKIRIKYYKDIASHVVLIVGDTLPKNPEYPLTMQRDDCGSTIKALIITKKEIKLSEKKFTNTVTCAGVGSDEKEFYILSH